MSKEKKKGLEDSLSLLSGEDYQQSPYQQVTGLIKSMVDENEASTLSEVTNSGELQEHSYIELYKRSKQLRSFLDANGAKQHDYVVILYDTAHEFVTAMWACFMGGYVAVPWSYSGVEKDQAEFLSSFDQLIDSLNKPYVLASSTGDTRLNMSFIEDDNRVVLNTSTIPNYQNILASVDSQADSIGLLIATSGTSGTPKLAMISYQSIFYRCMIILSSTKKKAKGGAGLTLVPLNTVSAQALVFPNKSSYYYNGFYLSVAPLEFIHFLAEMKVAHIGITSHTAHVLSRLLQGLDYKVDLSALKHVGFGADYIVSERVNKLLTAFYQCGAKNLQLSFAYGMTEVGLVATSSSEIDLSESEFDIQNTSLTSVLKAVSIRVVDNNDNVLPVGSMGEIQLKSPLKMFTGYYQQDNQYIFTSDGWYRSRDLGVIKQGALEITGRRSSLLKYTAEITTYEQLEEKLHWIDGIQSNLIFVSEIEDKKELLVFFVALKRDAETLNLIRSEIKSRITNYLGQLRLLPIESSQIQTTRTSKIHRIALKELYLEQRLSLNEAVDCEEPIESKAHQKIHYSDEIYQKVMQRWMTELKQNISPEPNQNLFDVGGDSLDFVIILSEMEKEFSIKLEAQQFYKKPLLSYLCEMIAVAIENRTERPVDDRDQTQKLWDTLSAFLLNWPGVSRDGDLILGLNTQGYKTPIFWVFQEAFEFHNLAKSLGKDQPLYAMRSLTRTEYSKYPEEIVNILADRYVTEILKLKGKFSMVLGGNCQGSVIALAVARKLLALNEKINKLVLLEWSKSTEVYEGDTFLLYGAKSPLAKIYSGLNKRNVNWKKAFPNRFVDSLPLGHNEYFHNKKVKHLADMLNKI